MGFVNSEEGYITEKSRSTALRPALIAMLCKEENKSEIKNMNNKRIRPDKIK